MDYSDVVKVMKADKASLCITLYKKVGLRLTWVILNIFPRVSANTITVSTLLLNVISAFFLYRAVLYSSYIYLGGSFALFNFSYCLDCVDGNIARFRNNSSIYGVFLDRLVHNISFPLLFFVLGFSLYGITQGLEVLILFITAGILTELSPIEGAVKDVGILFLKQMAGGSTKIYEVQKHKLQFNEQNGLEPRKNSPRRVAAIIKEIYGFLPLWNKIFFAILLDIVFFPQTFYCITIFSVLYILREIASSIRKTKDELNRIYTGLCNLQKVTK